MNITLVGWFMFSILLLMIMGLVSNSGTESASNMQDQMFLMNCPLPIYNGVALLTDIDDFGVTYTVTYDANVTSNGTFFECHTVAHANFATATAKQYGYTLFNTIPIGWLGYISDYLSASFQHVQSFFTIVAFVLTPANFDVMGFTISDLSGLALAFVVGIYIFAYVGIGVFVIPMLIGIIGKVV